MLSFMISEMLSLTYFFCLRGVIVASIVAELSLKMIYKIALSTTQSKIYRLNLFGDTIIDDIIFLFVFIVTYPSFDLCYSIRSVCLVEIIIILGLVDDDFRSFSIRNIFFFIR